MKKILFVTNKLVIGGIEKSLIELLKNLVEYYEITIIVNQMGGDLLSEIPEEIQVKKMSQIKMNNIYNILFKNKIFSRIKLRVTTDFAKQCEITTQMYEQECNVYDVAIAYSTPVSVSNYFVINKIKSRKKILFIHNDIEQIDANPRNCIDLYNKFDKIFAVSQVACANFCKMFPHLKNKTEVFYNLIDTNEIINLSNEYMKVDNSVIHIGTIGRLEYEKGQDIIPYIVKYIVEKGFKIKWHIIGDGTLKESMIADTLKMSIEDYIIFEGFQKNPYKYLNQCDIYVQTSRQEGFGITLLEAKLLNKPVVTSNFPVAYEHIKNKENGLIVDFNSKSFGDAIISLIEDKELCNFIKTNLKNVEIWNDLYKILDVIEER